MTSTTGDLAARAPVSRGSSTRSGRAALERQHIASCMADSRHLRADLLPAGWLPAPAPENVREARAYLTPRHATGVDEFLWEARERPMPDGHAVDAVIAASEQAQRGVGRPPELMDVAPALVVLSAIHLDLDQTEARLLNTAQAAGMSFEQIAAVLDLSVEEAEERHRRLKPRLDEPAAVAPTPLPQPHYRTGRPAGRRPHRVTSDRPTWDELNREDGED